MNHGCVDAIRDAQLQSLCFGFALGEAWAISGLGFMPQGLGGSYTAIPVIQEQMANVNNKLLVNVHWCTHVRTTTAGLPQNCVSNKKKSPHIPIQYVVILPTGYGDLQRHPSVSKPPCLNLHPGAEQCPAQAAQVESASGG